MKIALVGDIALYGKYSLENPLIFSYLDNIKSYLAEFDYVIGNLETPFSDMGKSASGKSACIKSSNKNINILKYLGINIVNIANNHMFDYGEEAFFNTLAILKENKIRYFGINDETLILEGSSNKVAFHGYCSYNTNPSGIYESNKQGVNALNIETLFKNMSINQANGFFNIISIHSGQEHINYPSTDDIKIARKLANEFDYIYYGHHPHVVQGTEEINNSLIAYSLGNFLFDDVYTTKSKKPLIEQSTNNKTGLILEIELKNNKVFSYQNTLIYQDDDQLKIIKKSNKDAYELLDGYSQKLKNALTNNDYKLHRQQLIASYIQGRKRLRDIVWYLRRINFNSIKIIINARKNSKKYKENVSRYL